MIKTEFKGVISEVCYPILGMLGGRDDKMIVLFSNHKVGTVVHSIVIYYPVGYHSSDWDMSFFIFDSKLKVTLENA